MFIKLVALVLLLANKMANLVKWLTMNYLTSVWGMNLTSAAAIVNILSGTIELLTTALNHLATTLMISESFLYPFTIIAIPTGLGLLVMSTPPVLANIYSTCSDYKPECVTQEQKYIFYAGLALIALGMAGRWPMSAHFRVNNKAEGESLSYDVFYNNCDPRDLPAKFADICFLAGAIVVCYTNQWSIKYGIAVIYMLMGVLIYEIGVFWYGYLYGQSEISLLSVTLRVIVASTLKLFYTTPTNLNELCQKAGEFQQLEWNTPRLFGCLEKAAIVLPDQPLEKQAKNRWKLCSVSEVENAKAVIGMIPIWITFIIVGMVQSLGNTYFLEQAKDLNPMVGKLRIPLPILLVFMFMGRKFPCIHTTSKKYVPFVGIAASMVLSTLCCIAAAVVEVHRLDKVKSHQEGRIPMSIFVLLPQYLLLGATDRLFRASVGRFFKHYPGLSSTYHYTHMVLFSRCFIGIGILGSMASVHVVGRVTEKGGNQSWFQTNINTSRFDNYCWLLAALSVVNLIVFVAMACFHPYKGSPDGEVIITYYFSNSDDFDDFDDL